MSTTRTITVTTLAMLAFAANSLLCRAALKHTAIDPATFTSLRILSGALVLSLLVLWRGNRPNRQGNWLSALVLVVYAAAFSFAYRSLSAATGALLLFGAVQATMISQGFRQGERLRGWQLLGFLLAAGGLVGLLLPGLSAPPLHSSLLMLGAGVAWGIYSLRGRGKGDPAAVTAGNFLRAAPLAAILSLVMFRSAALDGTGFGYALLSGGLTSGLGYVIWYTALPALKATQAATVQLSVPVLAALGGIIFLGESLTLRLLLAALAILGGIALVILEKRQDVR